MVEIHEKMDSIRYENEMCWELGSGLFFVIVVSNYIAPINKLIESIFGGNYLQFMFNDQASTAAMLSTRQMERATQKYI